jgi:hypothetical protein
MATQNKQAAQDKDLDKVSVVVGEGVFRLVRLRHRQ